MTDSAKPGPRPGDAPPRPIEMAIRNLSGWLYVKALAWVRAAPPEKELERARRISPPFRIPEDQMAAKNIPLAFDEPVISRVRATRFDYQVRLMVDIARMLGAGPKGILSRVKTSGLENLEAAIAENKGVLLVSAHAGTWWHAPAVVASLGHPISSVLMRFLPRAIVRYLEQVARELNCSLTFVRMGAYEAARAAFKRKETFFLSFDFASRLDKTVTMPIGTHATFQLDTGPGIMAVRHQVPLVWVDTFHDENGRSCVNFHPGIRAGRGTDHATPESVLHYLMDRLNDQLARHPEQWWLLGHALMHACPPSTESPQPTTGQS